MEIHALCTKFTEGTYVWHGFPSYSLCLPVAGKNASHKGEQEEWLSCQQQGAIQECTVDIPKQSRSRPQEAPQALGPWICHGGDRVQVCVGSLEMHIGLCTDKDSTKLSGPNEEYPIVYHGNLWFCLHISKSSQCGLDLTAECQIKLQNWQTNKS